MPEHRRTTWEPTRRAARRLLHGSAQPPGSWTPGDDAEARQSRPANPASRISSLYERKV
ncbi:hypothetical protein BDY21DRAFT_349993 [Lineolata rhizophorae]|uniref:Uncharacterized protein n=1 Tax=Lineolata rhizophorae TaxID=578093 RepID=A0A6A6NVY3_9PEZI|nr:hypothetical protein BDY21DRAFT_349993 [Lineolata rhizophorae]